MNNRLILVICLLAFGAMALCQQKAAGVGVVPGPAAVIPFLGGLLMNLRRRNK